jgi:hypothetical protein
MYTRLLVPALMIMASCSRPGQPEAQGGAPAQARAAAEPAGSKPGAEFAAYPAGPAFPYPPALPRLASAEARKFASQIREKAAAGPNFAGHYTIATWGCGSTCVGFAIVDARTGAVHFHPEIARVMQVPYQAEHVLQYRVDSRLLVIAGETEGPSGQSDVGRFRYAWTDDRFSLIGEAEIALEPGAPASPTGAGLDDLCAGFDNSLECAREIERYQLRKADIASRVKRAGGTLRLRLFDGRWHTLEDDLNADAPVRYNFRQYLPGVAYFLIHRQSYEGHDYLMVHRQTGRLFALHDVPVVSPDRQRLVTASNGVTGGYSPNAIQIWRLSDNGLELEQTLQPEGWGPSEATWLANDTISVTKTRPNPVEGAPAASATLQVTNNGTWQIK